MEERNYQIDRKKYAQMFERAKKLKLIKKPKRYINCPDIKKALELLLALKLYDAGFKDVKLQDQLDLSIQKPEPVSFEVFQPDIEKSKELLEIKKRTSKEAVLGRKRIKSWSGGLSHDKYLKELIRNIIETNKQKVNQLYSINHASVLILDVSNFELISQVMLKEVNNNLLELYNTSFSNIFYKSDNETILEYPSAILIISEFLLVLGSVRCNLIINPNAKYPLTHSIAKRIVEAYSV